MAIYRKLFNNIKLLELQIKQGYDDYEAIQKLYDVELKIFVDVFEFTLYCSKNSPEEVFKNMQIYINLCEQLAGQSAKVNQIPLFVLKIITKFLGFFEWGQTISDRLAFVEILNVENDFSKSSFDLYQIFKVKSSEINQLDDYFLEYFIRLLKRLRDINFEDIQKQKNLII
jgi:hypothetical protein